MDEEIKNIPTCDIAREFRKVVEEKARLESNINDLFAFLMTKGKRDFIIKGENEDLSYVFKILFRNKDKVAQFEIP